MDTVIKTPAQLEELKAKCLAAEKGKTIIRVSLGTCGIAAGGVPVLDAIKSELHNRGISSQYAVKSVGCMGLCYCEPTIELESPDGERRIYGDVTPAQIPAILTAGFGEAPKGANVIKRTWFYPEHEENTDHVLQARIALRNTGRIDPEYLEEYIAADGYQALAKVLTAMNGDQVCQLVLDSGLRGRGGAGFPTGKKWQFAKDSTGDKYMICNADEGDPGAFMDRAVLEGDPHAVLEAMTIGGFAIKANHGVIYVRAEYPRAIEHLQIAIEQATKAGLLGQNILGTGFNFDIQLKYGAGAFVCGEETALIHSVEGKRGEPTNKPPFPAVSGLWRRPTVVNNVETYACVAAIIRKGAAWFKAIGDQDSAGTKVFALAGKIKHTGLVEVPMGTTLRQIIFGLGDGIIGDKQFKAVQTGGPSGGCITAKNLDTGIDYGSLIRIGSMMGSGGMIVMDEDNCMVNIARFFLEFTCDESCGKCTACRIGNKRMFEMLTKICHGEGTEQTLTDLRNLANVVKDCALCGLGQTSPNPVLSTMDNFPEEYQAHVKEKRCPAGVCVNLLHYEITDRCKSCGMCQKACPVGCISGVRGSHQKFVIDQAKCVKCGTCMNTCHFMAIERK